MFRFLRSLFVALLLAALVAGAWRLYQSPNGSYTVREWFSGGGYHAQDALIVEAAGRENLDPMLVKAIVWRESRFRPDMVGKDGERGLMQVTEGAAQDWTRAEKIETFVATDLFDPAMNLRAGTWYLRRAMNRWKESPHPVPFALAEYNAGYGRVERWMKATPAGELATPQEFLKTVDIASTNRYVRDIMARESFYRKRGRL